jgi:hypothetical protein
VKYPIIDKSQHLVREVLRELWAFPGTFAMEQNSAPQERERERVAMIM